jgi:peptide/nickel transport system substrate-binding protein
LKKSILVAIIAVIIIVIAIVARYATTPPAPKYADTITIGVTDKVTDLDPSNAYDFFTWEVLSNVMEGLVK